MKIIAGRPWDPMNDKGVEEFVDSLWPHVKRQIIDGIRHETAGGAAPAAPPPG